MMHVKWGGMRGALCACVMCLAVYMCILSFSFPDCSLSDVHSGEWDLPEGIRDLYRVSLCTYFLTYDFVGIVRKWLVNVRCTICCRCSCQCMCDSCSSCAGGNVA